MLWASILMLPLPMHASDANKPANTFEAVAREWVEMRSNDWTEGHKALTLRTLEQDAFPALGRRPIAEITPSELLAAMRAIEKRGALEIASRVRQRSSAVFRYAIATDRCNSNPATELRGALKSPKRAHYKTIEKGGLAILKIVVRENCCWPSSRMLT